MEIIIGLSIIVFVGAIFLSAMFLIAAFIQSVANKQNPFTEWSKRNGNDNK